MEKGDKAWIVQIKEVEITKVNDNNTYDVSTLRHQGKVEKLKDQKVYGQTKEALRQAAMQLLIVRSHFE